MLIYNPLMFKRTLSGKLSALAKKFSVVSIMGPRQSGKTTLSKNVFKDHDYVSLEEPDEREFALSDPKGFLRRFPGGVILDEIQRVPNLLSYIQGILDREDSPGRFTWRSCIEDRCSYLRRGRIVSEGKFCCTPLVPMSLKQILSK